MALRTVGGYGEAVGCCHRDYFTGRPVQPGPGDAECPAITLCQELDPALQTAGPLLELLTPGTCYDGASLCQVDRLVLGNDISASA
ncbi:hypothetical protein NDU88_002573 [Pleurodeles waltl]|uniref:Uncharacterized protein n=1 Tax=Pleurodeles waltl TaxID=8319 RepID=A0AAV7VDP0_PLEWA|nr:hypothetical protein NDU88_002573 [Pleurodeles waltl]